MLKETSRLNRLCKFLPISKESGVINVNGSEGRPHKIEEVSSRVTVHDTGADCLYAAEKVEVWQCKIFFNPICTSHSLRCEEIVDGFLLPWPSPSRRVANREAEPCRVFREQVLDQGPLPSTCQALED